MGAIGRAVQQPGDVADVDHTRRARLQSAAGINTGADGEGERKTRD
jgi:hypothetical protein